MADKLTYDEACNSENHLLEWLCEAVVPFGAEKGTYYIEEPILYNKGERKLMSALERIGTWDEVLVDDDIFSVEFNMGFMRLAKACFAMTLEKDMLSVAVFIKENRFTKNVYETAMYRLKAVLENDEIRFKL